MSNCETIGTMCGRCCLAVLLVVFLRCVAPAQSLQERYERVREASGESGPGGQHVLKSAFEALQTGRYSQVGLEDLWATALQEGKNLFGSKRLWAATGPDRTGDMLGQTTIGPWQITIQNARDYGKRHGMNPDWSATQVGDYLEARPELQAALAADFIEDSYEQHGRRSPLAIQRYFWLEAFQRKEIGQGPWYASVLAPDLQRRKTTGFYAKQILLGSRFNPYGLLYWLHVTRDESSIKETLNTWEKAGYPVSPDDVSHCSCPAVFQEYLRTLLEKT